jgi:phage terminase small subunit
VPKYRTGELSDKQRAFVREYLCDHNATQAAIRAGYSLRASQKTSSDLLANPKVRAHIDEELARVAATAGLTQQKVLDDIERIASAAEKSGRFDAALRGRELQGKFLKMWTEKLEHTGADGAPLIPKKTELTDDQLAAIAVGRRG